jgi:hypothetical protein
VPNLGGRYQGTPGSALPTLPPGGSIGPGPNYTGRRWIFIPTAPPTWGPTYPTYPAYPTYPTQPYNPYYQPWWR